jgi:DNA-binding transcriptional LysR family regulator
VACSAVFAVEILPPILTRLRASWPDLDLELSVSNAVESILRRDADVAVRLVRPDQDAVVARRVTPLMLGLYAAPGPVAAAAAGMDWPTLAESGLLILQDRARTIETGLANLGLPLPRRAALRCDDDLAQLAAIRAGLGVGITQAAIALREGLLPICPDLRLPVDIWVAMHEDQRRLRRVKIVFDALVAGLGGP